jgi:hypothetical protein
MAVLLGVPFLIMAIMVLSTMRHEVRELFRTAPLLRGIYLLALILIIPVHEFVHALAYGQGLGSPHLIVGFWPRHGLAYAIFDSPLPRNRVLGMLVAPFLTLSVLPLLCLPWLQGVPWALVLVFSLLHAASCGGDVIVLVQLLVQVPSQSLVHNYGWQTYWKALGDNDHAG